MENIAVILFFEKKKQKVYQPKNVLNVHWMQILNGLTNERMK
jgi:hypothetical protein